MHTGHGNMDEEYKMGGAVLGRTTQEKDLGVTFRADMKVSEQCRIATLKGNQILGLIRRTIMYKEKQLIVPQIEVFKIVIGYEDVDRNMFFKLKEGSKHH